ncbi:FCD domain-containing protein [Pseudonocardia sp. NPDC049154]|uniref:FadR/GntR family transcriptional regulator n=1 Tax=Pseudonocardia sp. NPDC049154 TaxID=3155501 RepID=UPI0033CCC854
MSLLDVGQQVVREDGAGVSRKLAAQLAQRIEAEIISRGWPVGDVLGSEQELRERFRVSRAVLREAVRLVEHHQVARMRRGPHGGLFVVAPDAGPAARALVMYLEYIDLSVEDLMEARRLIEPLVASRAAVTIGESGIERLRGVLAEEAEKRADPRAASQDALHMVLGKLSGNPALELFADVLTRLTTRYAVIRGGMSREDVVRGKTESHERHTEIVDAVIAGAAGRAAAAVEADLAETTAWLLARHGPRRTTSGDDVPGRKLAEVVATRIRDDIVRRGWPVGLVLGSETDLLARYGISRAVLREAVRLVEYHGVARMRRGPGGGLVVAEPDPEACIDTMALYLDYRGVTPEDLRVVREAIELGALGRVVARTDTAEVAGRLEAAIARTAEPRGPGRTGADRFHAELAELSGNPLLVLFLRILTELWARHAASAPLPPPGEESQATVVAVHRRILEAMVAGDDGVARHRMRRHLEALTTWYH